MSHENKNVDKLMRDWELQQKQEGQQDLRDQYEYMNNKYQQMKNNYTSFSNVSKGSEIYNGSSDLADENGYMRYELNNTFNDKDDKKEK